MKSYRPHVRRYPLVSPISQFEYLLHWVLQPRFKQNAWTCNQITLALTYLLTQMHAKQGLNTRILSHFKHETDREKCMLDLMTLWTIISTNILASLCYLMCDEKRLFLRNMRVRGMFECVFVEFKYEELWFTIIVTT